MKNAKTWRKFLSCFLALSLLVSFFSFQISGSLTASAAAGDNLIENGDFSDGSTNWATHTGSGTAQIKAGVGENGSTGFQSNANDCYISYNKAIALKANTDYEVFIFHKTGGLNNTFRVDGVTPAADMTLVSSGVYSAGGGVNVTTGGVLQIYDNPAGGWATSKLVFNTGAQPRTLSANSLTLRLPANSAGSNVIDSVVLREFVPLPKGTNLLKNPDFSEGVTPWRLRSGTDALGAAIPSGHIVDEGVNGSKAMRLHNDLGTGYLSYPMAELKEALKANTTYEISYRAKSIDASASAGILFENGAAFGVNGVPGTGTFAMYSASYAGWVTMTHIFTTPGTAPSSKILFSFAGGGPYDRFIDSVSLKEIDKSETSSLGIRPSTAKLVEGATATIELMNTMTTTSWDSGVRNTILTGKAVTWNSSAPGVATVTNGVVTAVAAGTATITATIAGSAGNADIELTSSIEVYALPVVTKGENLLKNPDFSAGVTPWVLDSGAAIPSTRIAAGEGVNGSAAMHLNNSLGNVFLGYPISELKAPVKANTTYKLSYRFRALNDYEAIGVHFPSAFGVNGVSNGSSFAVYSTYCNGWATMTHTFTTPGTVPTTGSLFRFSGGGDTNRYIDSVSLIEIDASETLSIGLRPSVTEVYASKTTTIGLTNTITTSSWDSSILNTPLTGKTVTWSSSDINVATVANGVVTGVSAGTATITATIAGTGGNADVEITSDITVLSYTATTGISLNKNQLSLLQAGNSEQLTATVSPAGATIKAVAWSTSDNTVATVVNGLVTAVGKGVVTITVTAEDGQTAVCNVIVDEFTLLTEVLLKQREASQLSVFYPSGISILDLLSLQAERLD